MFCVVVCKNHFSPSYTLLDRDLMRHMPTHGGIEWQKGGPTSSPPAACRRVGILVRFYFSPVPDRTQDAPAGPGRGLSKCVPVAFFLLCFASCLYLPPHIVTVILCTDERKLTSSSAYTPSARISVRFHGAVPLGLLTGCNFHRFRGVFMSCAREARGFRRLPSHTPCHGLSAVRRMQRTFHRRRWEFRSGRKLELFLSFCTTFFRFLLLLLLLLLPLSNADQSRPITDMICSPMLIAQHAKGWALRVG